MGEPNFRISLSKDLYRSICRSLAALESIDEPEVFENNPHFKDMSGVDPKDYLLNEAENIFHEIYESCGGDEAFIAQITK